MVHSVELLFDPDTESAIRRVWERLSELGLRSPALTSRPHVTLARRVEPGQLARALTVRKLTREIKGDIVGLRRWDGNKRIEYPIG